MKTQITTPELILLYEYIHNGYKGTQAEHNRIQGLISMLDEKIEKLQENDTSKTA